MDQFHLKRDPRCRDGAYRTTLCRDCNKIQCKAWAKRNPKKVKAYYTAEALQRGKRRYATQKESFRNYQLMRDYGLTLEEVQQLYADQRGRCAICEKPCELYLKPTRGRGAKANMIVIDHCHATGTVRGLLCVGCNVALGMFADSAKLLTRAIAYLKLKRPARSAVKPTYRLKEKPDG